ncbi:MSMEG_0572/Sll0783 family nitrogen starvation response protein [Frankia sp. AgKG'84/4]|uniref:MSMEG_0572/Sll0783 family nitrogen starvation response protein n=1 Tax=Frankia sp. AgKG'84/4 TaxID=573490 RepID=UPI0020107B20|nr:MSMEG_0572/Sll0783 family nitrogen starvation response protein [Frankia sp. AgKG'84/4]MCL9796742.1 MSMEG_0572 family nitrogen starvation response protein [Frankia sp. AgKG'84/4]
MAPTQNEPPQRRPAQQEPGQQEPGQDERALTENERRSLAEIPHPSLAPGTSIYGSTKIFPDYHGDIGEAYLALVHGIAHESSVSFVAILQATRALRKGFESVLYFHGPGAMNTMATRGFPHTGDSAFPGQHNINNQIETFIREGGKVYVCRFGLSLHGLREEDVITGVIPAHPLDLQDCVIHYSRKGAIISSSFML